MNNWNQCLILSSQSTCEEDNVCCWVNNDIDGCCNVCEYNVVTSSTDTTSLQIIYICVVFVVIMVSICMIREIFYSFRRCMNERQLRRRRAIVSNQFDNTPPPERVFALAPVVIIHQQCNEKQDTSSYPTAIAIS